MTEPTLDFIADHGFSQPPIYRNRPRPLHTHRRTILPTAPPVLADAAVCHERFRWRDAAGRSRDRRPTNHLSAQRQGLACRVDWGASLLVRARRSPARDSTQAHRAWSVHHSVLAARPIRRPRRNPARALLGRCGPDGPGPRHRAANRSRVIWRRLRIVPRAARAYSLCQASATDGRRGAAQ